MQAHAIAVEKPPFAQSREPFDAIVDRLGSVETLAMTHSELETLIEAEGTELLRRLLQDHLDLRGSGEAAGEAVVGTDGKERTHKRPGERGLVSIFGPVTVSRIGYGARGFTSLHPRDAELNLPADLYSHGVRRRAAEEAAKTSFDETVQALERTTGAHVPKRQAEEIVRRAATDFDAFYKTRETADPSAAEKTGSILVLTADGKGVVVRTEDLREATRKKAEANTHKMWGRLSSGEKKHAKRMATVAAVYTIEPFVRRPEDVVRPLGTARNAEASKRPKPERKRVWASLEKGNRPM